MLHYQTVDTPTLELLKKLQQLSSLQNTRLVGGTALALQIGHRKSIGIDLFGDPDPDPFMFKEISWELVKARILSLL